MTDLATLRERPDSERPDTNDEAWTLLHVLRQRADRDREEASEELARLFAAGAPSIGIDGPTEGMLVTPLIQPHADLVLRAITRLWMPWRGKRFDAEHDTGDNLLARSSRWPARLLWPGYRMGRPTDGAVPAFRFRTRVEPGALDDGVEVLVIDYQPVGDNPNLVIRKVRDELVRLVADVHLGRILYRRRGGYQLIGYFALRA